MQVNIPYMDDLGTIFKHLKSIEVSPEGLWMQCLAQLLRTSSCCGRGDVSSGSSGASRSVGEACARRPPAPRGKAPRAGNSAFTRRCSSRTLDAGGLDGFFGGILGCAWNVESFGFSLCSFLFHVFFFPVIGSLYSFV